LRDSPKTACRQGQVHPRHRWRSVPGGRPCQRRSAHRCAYAEFPDHFGFFLPLAGITTVKQIRESSFDIGRPSRLNKLYVELLKDNPDWARPSGGRT
jgi:hypothetical protein